MKHLIYALAVVALSAPPVHAEERVRGANDLQRDQKEIVSQRTTESGRRYRIRYQMLSKDANGVAIDDQDLAKLESAKGIIKVEVQTEGCADCVTTTNYYVSDKDNVMKGAPDLYTKVADIIAAIEKTKEEDVVIEKHDDKKSEKKVSKKEDPEYLELACADETDDHDRALCIAGNLEEIKEKSKEDRKYDSLYKKSVRFVKNQAAQCFDVEDPREISEGRSCFQDLAAAASDSGDRKLISEMRSMGRSLETAARERVIVDNIRREYEDRYLPQLTQAAEDIQYGKSTDNFMLESNARARYDWLYPRAQMMLNDMKRYSPENDIAILSNYTDASSLSFLDDYFRDAYEAMRTSMIDAQNMGRGVLGSDHAIADVVNGNSPRMSRSGGISAITQYQYGQPYNNSLVQNDPMSDFYSGNNSMSQFAGSQLMQKNPQLASGRQYRTF